MSIQAHDELPIIGPMESGEALGPVLEDDRASDEGAEISARDVDDVEGKTSVDVVSDQEPRANGGKNAKATSDEKVDSKKSEEGAKKRPKKAARPKNAQPNNVRKMRIERMMSKAELARRANLSVLTIDRVEKGFGCRMNTKRKILEALGLSLADRVKVFGEEE